MNEGSDEHEKRSTDRTAGSQRTRTVDRRTFIKATGGGLAAAPALASLAADGDGAYDVVVIGGGFAGVTAARETSLRGLSTLLLEARPRLGGRTLTLPLAGHDLDLGGTWVGWSQPHVWSEIMRYRLDIDESAAAYAEHAVWMADGERRFGPYGDYAVLFERTAKAMYAPARAAFPRPFAPRHATGSDALDQVDAAAAIAKLELGATERGLALSLASINGHAPPHESSYLDQQRWYALGDFDPWNMFDNLARYRVRGGTRRLLDTMHGDSRAETRLGQPVRAVSQDGNGVTVRTADGNTVRARTAIVAVPLNCLADLGFEPALDPAKLRVSRARHTGSGTKVYARIRGGQPVFAGHGLHDMPLNFLWTEYDDGDSQVLVGFGASGELLDVASETAVAAAVRDYLPDAELLEFFTYDWNVDPYSRGTWCMYRPGVLSQDFEALVRAEGRVHFAGADIALGWRGFIDGAIESGLAVGRDVAARLLGTA